MAHDRFDERHSFNVLGFIQLLYDTTCVNSDFWVKPVWGLGCAIIAGGGADTTPVEDPLQTQDQDEVGVTETDGSVVTDQEPDLVTPQLMNHSRDHVDSEIDTCPGHVGPEFVVAPGYVDQEVVLNHGYVSPQFAISPGHVNA